MKSLVIALVRLFPRPFRQQFGAEIADHIAADHDAARARGIRAVWWFWLATVCDLATSVMAERWNPTWAYAPAPAPFRETTMRSMLGEWARDLRFAVRTLRRAPGFTAVTAGTLALAIGVNAAMFGVVDTVLLNPLPYAHMDRLVVIAGTAPGSQLPAEFGVAAEFYLQYKESRFIEDVAAFTAGTSTLRTDDRVERVSMAWPTNSLYSTLGAAPILGRLPRAEDESRVAMISYGLWQSWFNGDSSVLGRIYEISGAKREIIGVMGPDFRFPSDETQVWIAGDYKPEGLVSGRLGMSLVARITPGATPEAVAGDLTALSKRLPARFGGTATYTKLIEQHHAIVQPLEERMLGQVARPLWVLLAAVGIVLIIACANVANLFLVRTESRQRELALRRAVGAGRGQLVRLQLSEALVVAGLAAVVAMAIAFAGLPAFLHAAPAGIPRISDLRFNTSTLVFTWSAAIIAALACGILPALKASSPRLARLRESGRGTTRRTHWTRDGLVVAQTALALVLLIGSGLLIRSFDKLSHVDPGYDTANIFTFQVAPSGPAFQTEPGPAFARFHMNMMERIRALPGVELVGVVDNIPLNEGTAISPFRAEGASDDFSTGVRLNYTSAAGDYYKAMGIKLLRGETFASRDLAATQGKVVISQSAAERLWPGQDPIGRRLQALGDSTWETVIGVVADVMQDNFRDTAQSLVYFPLIGHTPTSWVVGSPAYVIKTRRAETIAPEIRALARELAPNAPVYRVFTLAGLARDSMVQLSFTMLTLGIVSTLALVLGAVGLYGVLSYVVAERTKEIGVRMALGAEGAQVRRMVVAQGTTVVVLGVLIGIPIALVSTKALGRLLFNTAAVDATTFVTMSVSMVLVGMLASYVPARRASSVDPMQSLRGD